MTPTATTTVPTLDATTPLALLHGVLPTVSPSVSEPLARVTTVGHVGCDGGRRLVPPAVGDPIPIPADLVHLFDQLVQFWRLEPFEHPEEAAL